MSIRLDTILALDMQTDRWNGEKYRALHALYADMQSKHCVLILHTDSHHIHGDNS